MTAGACCCAIALGLATLAAHAGDRHALLVGVTAPTGIDTVAPLAGVERDVALMAELSNAWGVPRIRRHILAQQEGADAAPTYGALMAAFKRLAGEVRSGDEILLYFAGHGTQQPAANSSDADEDDGVDEVFLLSDSTPWSATLGSIGNALVDNELRRQIETFASRGAFVWLVVDSCHAGTLARNELGPAPQASTADWTAIATRRISPEALGVDVLRVLRRVMPKIPRLSGVGRKHVPGLAMTAGPVAAKMPPIAAFYAVPASGDALEVALKPGGERLGLFTLKLKATFDSLRRRRGSPPTFEELARAILAGYESLPEGVSRPAFEGSEWGRLVWDVPESARRAGSADVPAVRESARRGTPAGR